MPPSGGEKGMLSSYSGHSAPPSGGENCIMRFLPEGRRPYCAPTEDILYLLRRGENGIICLHPERKSAYLVLTVDIMYLFPERRRAY